MVAAFGTFPNPAMETHLVGERGQMLGRIIGNDTGCSGICREPLRMPLLSWHPVYCNVPAACDTGRLPDLPRPLRRRDSAAMI